MSKTFTRGVFAVLALAYVLTHFMGHAHAQSSLGIGANEAVLPQTGLFGGFLHWVNVHQQQFYASLREALTAMRTDASKGWVLVALSFAYGVFHAAGPGHGKAVISSYMLANEVALRRGVMLSFVSAFLQAATAIVLIGMLFLFLRGTSVTMTNATRFLEIASYVLVTLFGAWLLWQKASPRVAALLGSRPAHSLSAAAAAHAHHGHDHRHADDDACGCGHDHHHHAHDGHSHHDHAHDPHPHGHHDHAHHHHAHGETCASCGHSHAPDPAMLSGDRFEWRTAWSAVAAVGIRPCSGALLVLTFAFLHGLWLGGIASVLAMALGTAITVSLLATLAVMAKNWAVALSGDGRAGNRVHATIEIGGAAMVFLLGLMLLSASLST